MEGNGVKTNAEVEATAFAGNATARLENLEARSERIENKVDMVLAKQNYILGYAAGAGLVAGLIAAVAIKVFG